MTCEAKREGDIWVCAAVNCPHHTASGCALGKVGLTCDNSECVYSVEVSGVYRCKSMDVHLDAGGACIRRWDRLGSERS